MPRILTLAAIGLFLLALSAIYFASGGGARAATVNVDVGDTYFCSPANSGSVCETNVSVGDTVVWQVSSGTHTVTECQDTFSFATCTGGFDSGIISSGQTFSNTFNVAGAFEYWCSVHLSAMAGRINVAAQATSTPTPTSTATQAGSPTASPTGGTPIVTPASAPITGDAASATLLSWATLLTLAGALLLGSSAVLVMQTIRRR